VGTYWIAVNHTRKEYFSAHDLGGGAKIREWILNSTAKVFALLLTHRDIRVEPISDTMDGRWSLDKIELVGDDAYGEDLHELACSTYRDIGPELKQAWDEATA
jgi:hypothetical protein